MIINICMSSNKVSIILVRFLFNLQVPELFFLILALLYIECE